MRRTWLLLPVALLAIGVLAWSQRSRGPFFVSGFIEADDIRVGSRVGGRVRAVSATEGQHVAAGDLLVALEAYDLNERRAQAEAQLAAHAARLAELEAGSRPEELAQARAARDRAQAVLDKAVAGPRPLEIRILEENLEQAQAELAYAESEFQRIKALFDGGRAAPNELAAARSAFDATTAQRAAAAERLALACEGTRAEEIAEARASLAFAQAALTLSEAGPRQEVVAQARAAVEGARAAVAAIDRQLTELNIVAPTGSVVDAVDLQPGDLIAPSAPVVTLLDPSHLWVRAYVPENRLNLALGQKVSIAVDSLPGRRFAGEIAYVSRQAEFTPANVQTPEERSQQVFRIKVRLSEGLDALRAGMAADVYFEPAR